MRVFLFSFYLMLCWRMTTILPTKGEVRYGSMFVMCEVIFSTAVVLFENRTRSGKRLLVGILEVMYSADEYASQRGT